MTLVEISQKLAHDVDAFSFAPPVTHVYNPLRYAWTAHARYLELYGSAPKEVLFLGMNPGPFGMAQTGIPFGEIAAARDWLGIEEPLDGRPEPEHPKRPIQGFDCPRSEVSGRRVWGWAQERFGSAERFFEKFYVANYCPLVFLEESGRNRTPEKLKKPEREALFEVCDRALAETVEALGVSWVIGVGKFAEDRARAALDGQEVTIARILHPSPANPAANKGWSDSVNQALEKLGIAQ